MKVAILASGSAGNASLFESRGTRVLVDAGVGPRTLAAKLREAGSEGPPQAIVVTHAHQDHVGHCLRLARQLKVPIYASEATARTDVLRGRDEVRVFSAREPFAIGAFTVSPTPLPHDAAQVALVFSDGVRSAAIVTDLGEVPPDLPRHLAGCDVLLLESNHDAQLLAGGSYPPHLKRRIASAGGHLSNAQAHALLRVLTSLAVDGAPGASSPLHTVVLMHLSRTNNRPDLALEVGRDALAGSDVRLLAAAQNDCLVLDVDSPSAIPVTSAAANGRGASPTRVLARGQLSLFSR